MKDSHKIVVRMAPSPTGNLHVGTARTTLYNYLFAKKMGGTFILRVEDTDTERSTKEFEENILNGLKWLGLTYDEFFRQSERTDTYVSYIQKMLDNGSAYISKEEVTEEGQRSEVIRFKNPNKIVQFEDLIRGTVGFDTTELKNFVIARSIQEPLYHLAVVIDDHEMNVTHIIRGEDHISNTPRQILIQEAIGAARPVYAHIPLILDSDRKKLSKRKHGPAVQIDTYMKEGYLPDALLNFLAFIGWNPGGEKEVYTLPELVEAFDIERVQKGGGIFDIEKLKWFNKEHMKLLPETELKGKIREAIVDSKISDEMFEKIWKLIFERMHTFGDAKKIIESGEFDFALKKPVFATELLFWKGNVDASATIERLQKVVTFLENISDTEFTATKIKDAIWDYASSEGRGEVLWPIRVALSGKEKSPDPFVLGEILGKAESLERIKNAIEKLSHA